ncbi:hypothetical protein CSUI_007223, partial [Cystoisospora suis]
MLLHYRLNMSVTATHADVFRRKTISSSPFLVFLFRSLLTHVLAGASAAYQTLADFPTYNHPSSGAPLSSFSSSPWVSSPRCRLYLTSSPLCKAYHSSLQYGQGDSFVSTFAALASLLTADRSTALLRPPSAGRTSFVFPRPRSSSDYGCSPPAAQASVLIRREAKRLSLGACSLRGRGLSSGVSVCRNSSPRSSVFRSCGRRFPPPSFALLFYGINGACLSPERQTSLPCVRLRYSSFFCPTSSHISCFPSFAAFACRGPYASSGYVYGLLPLFRLLCRVISPALWVASTRASSSELASFPPSVLPRPIFSLRESPSWFCSLMFGLLAPASIKANRGACVSDGARESP